MPETAARGRMRTAVLLGAFVLLTYANVFKNGWTYYDDFALARERYRVTAWSAENLRQIWTPQGNYVPLRDTVFLLDSVLFGPGIAGYQATNLLWHWLGLWAFAALVRRQWGDPTVALTAALLFAAHPLHVESVAWVAGSKDLMCFAFCCLATLFYVRGRDESTHTGRNLTAAAVCLVLALSAKLAALGLPVVLAAAELCDPNPKAARWQKRVLRWLPFALITLVWFALAVTPVRDRIGDLMGMETATRSEAPRAIQAAAVAQRQELYWPALRAMVLVTWRYLGMWFWPFGLTAIYTVPLEESWFRPPVLAGLLGISAVLGTGAWLWSRGWRRTVFWLAWAVAFYIPVSNIMPVAALMNDRYVHLPSAAGSALLAGGLIALVRKAGRRRPVARAAVAGCIAALSVATVAQVTVWRSPRTLWEHALATQPDNARIHITLAGLLVLDGRAAEAVPKLQALERDAPDNYRRLLMLSQAYADLGRLGPAARTLERALEVYPEDPVLLTNYATVLARQEQYAEALALADRILQRNPNAVAAYIVRAFAHAGLGEAARSAEACAQAVRLAPGSVEIRMAAARALLEAGDPAGAVEYARAAYRMAPSVESGLVYVRALEGKGDAERVKVLLEELQAKWPSDRALDDYIVSGRDEG